MRVVRSLLVGVLASAPFALQAQARLVFFTGTVVDSTKRPIENAEISIEGMNLKRSTDSKGNFKFETVAAGVHHITVRRIGYAQLDTSMAFPEDKDVEWRVTMREKVVTLDSVIVTAPLDPLARDFEENRKRGFGRFMTRADLTKVDGVTFSNVLRGLPGADIVRTNSVAAFITSKRAPISGCGPPPSSISPQAARAAQEAVDECLRRERIYYVPDPGERMQGVMRACYPQVWVDNQLMNPGRPTPPFDVNSYATEQIESVQWFESESQTPPRYSVNNARCGVLLLNIRKKR